ncbi:MAG: hypothetical protein QNL04_09595 [SAR324 cluster bacterium]|nr:hypothetical protein [SAR324 cluster bacterium]
MTVTLTTTEHPRQSPFGNFIYPVLSRRSAGLSLGVNVNVDKECSFSCVYCQVDRSPAGLQKKPLLPDLETILQEVEDFLKGGHELADKTLKDIAIAGDGEPTQVAFLPELLLGLLGLLKKYKKDNAKLILFTNGSGLTKPSLQPALTALTEAGGEIWFKFDFWDEDSFMQINRPKVKFQTIIQHLIEIGGKFPLVLQSCLFEGQTEGLIEGQINFDQDKYLRLAQDFLEAGVTFKKIQLYSIARMPTEAWVKAMSPEKLEQVAKALRQITNCPVEVY